MALPNNDPEEASDFVPAVFARSDEEAQLYRSMLSDRGIPSIVGKQNDPKAGPGRKGHRVSRGFPVLVPDSKLDEASIIIAGQDELDEFAPEEDAMADKGEDLEFEEEELEEAEELDDEDVDDDLDDEEDEDEEEEDDEDDDEEEDDEFALDEDELDDDDDDDDEEDEDEDEDLDEDEEDLEELEEEDDDEEDDEDDEDEEPE